MTASPSIPPKTMHFGAFLKSLRARRNIRQLHILASLPTWTQTTYSRLESGEIAPAFAQLLPIYAAFHEAGLELTAQDRQQFLTLARSRIESKKTCREIKTDQEWDALRVTLSQFDHRTAESSPLPSQERLLSRPGLVEIRHLLGRADWLASVMTAIAGPARKKLLVLQGPTGIGKSSELQRLAQRFLALESPPHVVFCALSHVEQQPEPENALDQLLGSLLIEIGSPDAAIQGAALKVRIAYTLRCLEKRSRPVLALIDNAEQVLEANGQIAACWEDFLRKFLRSQHHATLILATKEWPGWAQGERLFVSERTIPPLTEEDSITLLQNQELAAVPPACLRQAGIAASGIPLCLEWIATLVKKPLWLDAWDDLDDLSDDEESQAGEVLTRRLLRLLDDPALFRGEMTDRLTPLLDRILAQRLSVEAIAVLRILSLANVPLGTFPLQRLCPRPSLLKELRRVSLLTAHQQRVQVLPTVAALVRTRLSEEQRRQMEGQLIDAYWDWLNHDEEMSDRERGMVIAELAMIYLRQHRLLDAADLLIAHGWMSFNLGYGPRLGRLAEKIMHQFDWKQTRMNECGGLLLYHLLTPFLGKAIDDEQGFRDFQYVLAQVNTDKVSLQETTMMELVRVLMWYQWNQQHFEEALAILADGTVELESYRQTDIDVQTSLLAFRAMLLAKWSNFLEEQGALEKASFMREEVIALFRKSCTDVANTNKVSPLNRCLLKKRLSAYLNYLAYHLTRHGRAAEAIEILEQSIALGEQGYCNFGALASAYGDMSQALMELGRFEEALIFDEKAMVEVQRCADSGETLSQDEIWVYRVNRGVLYFRLGRIEEAESLLLEAQSHIQPHRSAYRLLASRVLDEIKQHHIMLPTQQSV
jgi:tetratricopeptide (TPR) repeat protein/transcriptional regulator with XRE-family HTH domain